MRNPQVADKPLWNTETGWRLELGPTDAPAIDPKWPKLNAEQSAAYVSRALLIGWAAGLQRYYWYSWDHGDMGFVRRDGRTTASADAYLTTRRWLEGVMVRRCQSHDAIWVCELERAGNPNLIVWSEDASPRQWEAPQGFTSLESLSGQETLINPGQSVSVGAQPMLLKQ